MSRSRQMSRSLQFEALERRVAMSTIRNHPGFAVPAHGGGPSQADHARGASSGAPVVRAEASTAVARPGVAAAAKSAAIKGNFHGGRSSLIPNIGYVAMGGATGKLGKVPFQATMFGQVSGTVFEGGTLHLFNSSGVILADLGRGKLVKKGKTENLKVVFVFQQGTGTYAPVVGWAGTAKFAIKPQKSAAQASTPLESDWSGEWDFLQVFLDSFFKALAYEFFLRAHGMR